ncbi:hypothetical protein O7635_14420 [Asanoa sp. WMMD1127]|uniref:hypothetical protein n=1 Tax=Asanoa sp. WMMD1127 TaxID=3016107 RepID=UPI00241796DC|nr:hypothetical protein [Asanoa sp. WMMD1127]MDG4823046.1 hypothetical protein [Asanoa sp. WMMD1127]
MDRTAKAALRLVAGHVAVLATCALWVVTRPERAPGPCTGDDATSTACTWGPRVAAALLAYTYALPAVAASLLVCLGTLGVVAAVRRRAPSRVTGRGHR